jgi:hypothetical protein
MPVAVSNQKALASLVEERRLASPDLRKDVRELLTLSLHCRAALNSLAPTVDRRAAESLGNTVLVELRAATLLYLSTARAAGDGNTAAARAAVVEHLRSTEAHASKLLGLAPESAEDTSMGAALSKDVVAELHKTSLEWGTVTVPATVAGAA